MHARRRRALAFDRPGSRLRSARTSGELAGSSGDPVHLGARIARAPFGAGGATWGRALQKEPRTAPPYATDVAGTALSSACRIVPAARRAPERPLQRGAIVAGSPYCR